jgi:hypothetical protein
MHAKGPILRKAAMLPIYTRAMCYMHIGSYTVYRQEKEMLSDMLDYTPSTFYSNISLLLCLMSLHLLSTLTLVYSSPYGEGIIKGRGL